MFLLGLCRWGNNLLDRNLGGHHIQRVLRHHDIARFTLKNVLDGGSVFSVGLDKILCVIGLNPDTALLLHAVAEVIKVNRFVLFDCHLRRAEENACGRKGHLL